MSFYEAENACVKCFRKQDSVSNLTGETLLVNSVPTCLHKFCNQCVDREFSAKRQFKCPVESCTAMVKRGTLTAKTADEHEVSEDARIRKKIKNIYNKCQNDFESLKAFNDYEEEVEDIIYNLVHGIDVDNMNKKVEKYSNDNKDVINENTMKRDKEAREEDVKIKEEKHSRLERQLQAQREDDMIRVNKRRLRQETNELMLGERDKMSASSGFSSFMVPPGMPRQPNDSKESSSVNATNYNPYEMFFKQRALPNMLPLEESKVIAAKKRNEAELHRDENYRKAGGFDARMLDRRNWFEMLSCFPDIKVSDAD